uniref:Uncharacterized protein n=1 Tax=Lepisosteus oculatus TaxID=7918 RepID=W5M5V9_LEPOC
FQVHGPAAPVVVSPGEDAVLPCYLSPSISAVDLEIRWFRGDYNSPVRLYQNLNYNTKIQNPAYRDRAELFLQELPRGNVSLKLTDVRLSDHGQYKCLVESVDHYEDTLISLAVRDVSVSLHSPGGGQTQLLCRSEGWFPAPAVIWTDRDGHDVTSLSSSTVGKDSQGLLSVNSYIPVQQESNIFSCLVRSTQSKADGESQLHIPRDFFPEPSGWMVALCVTAAVTVAASALLVIQWRRMKSRKMQTGSGKGLTSSRSLTWSSIRGRRSILSSKQISDLFWRYLHTSSRGQPGGPYHIPLFERLYRPVDVSLDPRTAGPHLALSEDGKEVRYCTGTQTLPDTPERFSDDVCVLGREGFTSGKHYWEAEVRQKTDWAVGVARDSVKRKGEVFLYPDNGYWTLCLSSRKGFEACTFPPTPLSQSLKPRRVGVYVDYEEGQISFYNVKARCHIYTFRHTFNEKLYPFFDPCLDSSDAEPLILCPV